MKFKDVFSQFEKGKHVRRTSWRKGRCITNESTHDVSPKDIAADDWEVYEIHLSDLKPGQRFIAHGMVEEQVMLANPHFSITDKDIIKEKINFLYFNPRTHTLHGSEQDLIVKEILGA